MFKSKIEEVPLNYLCSTEIPSKKNQIRTFIKLRKFGYPSNDDYILVSKNYEIIKGNHWYCALKKLKGEESKIKVKKLKITKDTYVFLYFNFAVAILIIFITILKFFNS